MAKIPVIDLSGCTDCESCIALCPGVFQRNTETGRIEVRETGEYSEGDIEEAMAMCPADCISWEEDDSGAI
jgi:ferredoxin